MEREKEKVSGGIGCFTVIGIVFLVLKLVGVHPVDSWSWIWVLSPFWIPIALVVFLCFVSSVFVYFVTRKRQK